RSGFGAYERWMLATFTVDGSVQPGPLWCWYMATTLYCSLVPRNLRFSWGLRMASLLPVWFIWFTTPHVLPVLKFFKFLLSATAWVRLQRRPALRALLHALLNSCSRPLRAADGVDADAAAFRVGRVRDAHTAPALVRHFPGLSDAAGPARRQ